MLPRNYMAPEDMKISIVPIDVYNPTVGIRHLDEAEKIARNFSEIPLYNKSENIVAFISKNHAAKICAAKAASGVSAFVFTEAVKNIALLFREAKLGASHPDNKQRPEILQIHRMYSAFYHRTELIGVKFTLREYNIKECALRIYTIQPENLEIESIQKSPAPSKDVPGSLGETGKPIYVRHLYYKSFFEKFKIVTDKIMQNTESAAKDIDPLEELLRPLPETVNPSKQKSKEPGLGL